MALRSSFEARADDDTYTEAPPRVPPDPVISQLSPTSDLTSTSMASPSPVPYLNLAEQTFTPLSMDGSDAYLSDSTEGHGGGRRAKSLRVAVEAEKLLRKARSAEHLRSDATACSSGSTAPAVTPALLGATTTVSAMVQSFEALHAATAARRYELLSAKNAGNGAAGLVSPPSTISPSPSPSRSPSPSPAADQSGVLDAGLGTTVGPDTARQEKLVATQDENAAVPQTAAATSHPDLTQSNSNALPAHNPSDSPLSASAVPDTPGSAAFADTTIIRPTPLTRRPETPTLNTSNPTRPPFVRTSSTASLTLSHPTPDANKRSQAGGFLGNIAALEATAERLSMTSSIEDAIRDEHNELKRSESRRSSILRANRARAASASESGSILGQSQLSRQNSILETNSAARSGGYSPGAYIMSQHNPLSPVSTRMRSGSKASSIGMPSSLPGRPDTADGETGQEFRFLPRHGPGKASTRSVASKLSLVQIAELDLPTTLTQEALDEADRAASAGIDREEEDTIRASAHQFIDAEFADESDILQPMLGHDSSDERGGRLQLHQPDQYHHYGGHGGGDERPGTSGSGTTYEQAQDAFGDFDGVHCDPEASVFATPRAPAFPESPPRPQTMLAPRPKSYLDPATGQQMLFYPAPVPAMLNLPPKLSKKPKAAARNTRQSQIVSAMPEASRHSRAWLPDPTEGLRGSQSDPPFMDGLLGEDTRSHMPAPSGMEGGEQTQATPLHARQASEASTIQPPPPESQREIRIPQRLTDGDNRKSRISPLDGVPPQLRASAFFVLPSAAPRIEVKGGSAMATLDSILDASAAAPVSAFTDHAFAGKLGAEVYGPEKKRKMKKTTPAPAPEEKSPVKPKKLVKRNSSSNLLDPPTPGHKKLVKRNSSSNLLDPPTPGHKKRASHFSLFGGRRNATEESDSDEDEARNGRPRSRDEQASPNQLAPDSDEESEEGDEEGEEEQEGEEVYQGPPTTLLAELQLRKQQNKMRTRPITNVYPNGMHSTLLELDAVREVERKARAGKRVNLAWEDPNANPDPEEEDDDDVPLGMLAVQKVAGKRSTMDISAVLSEVNRPLGLMERRELEDNEPLSRRRDRLQGRESTMLPLSLSVIQKRMSHMPLTTSATAPGALGLRSQSRLTLPLQPAGPRSLSGSRPGSVAGREEDSEPEVEGETLAARKARLAAENPLPRARPVSGVFSSELLSQFGGAGDDDDDGKQRPLSALSKGKAKSTMGFGSHSRTTSAELGKENAPPMLEAPVPEEEETLGQRRRRLQNEREAREREMAAGGARATTPLGLLNPNPIINSGNIGRPPLSRPLSMADMLAAHPLDSAAAPGMGAMHVHHHPHLHPAEQERLRREAEAARAQREKDAKMVALRAQMPTSLTAPAVGARTGGYMNGRFNDGLGGGQGAGALSLGYGGGMGMGVMQQQQQQQQQQQRASTFVGGVGPYGGVNASGFAHGSTPNVNMAGMGMGMGMHGGGNAQGHIDMVERWRQGVLP
ncbi:hypothetical protein MFIFM68171_02882 [Madurella fahalii]|uniref:Uncharacterized protein n=1 Tax=Madurella fahalii TaxID=1157608 RepID=A0ABQ0G4K0_9PEZI